NGIGNGLINLGGNVHVVGTKTDGSKWRVGIQNPENDSEYIGVLTVSDSAVITSGGYERYFEEEGITYHHIIDPSTGYPAENGLISVTIVSKDGTLADGLSTSLYVMGLEKAEQYWQEHSEEFDAILLTEGNELYVTEGITEDFSSDQEFHVIMKEK
ncbi:MAG: FAD:protein FMN transferase, partial [Ruminococcus sp.]|nr:FAD:protein FMN transferase [Ruminococcus sp.]